MPKFQFDGHTDTWAAMPDGMVVLAAPGDVFDLPYDEPGTLWSKTQKKATRQTPAGFPAYMPDAEAPLDTEGLPDTNTEGSI